MPNLHILVRALVLTLVMYHINLKAFNILHRYQVASVKGNANANEITK